MTPLSVTLFLLWNKLQVLRTRDLTWLINISNSTLGLIWPSLLPCLFQIPCRPAFPAEPGRLDHKAGSPWLLRMFQRTLSDLSLWSAHTKNRSLTTQELPNTTKIFGKWTVIEHWYKDAAYLPDSEAIHYLKTCFIVHKFVTFQSYRTKGCKPIPSCLETSYSTLIV